MNTLDVVVVVVTYNSAAVVTDLLAGLPAAVGDLRAHVVVVDNGSTDATLAAVQPYPVHVIRSSNIGYAGAINLGVASAPASETVLVLNPDVTLAPLSVVTMMQTLASSPRIGIVAPQLRGADGSLQRSLRREPTLLRAAGLGRTRYPLLCEHFARDSDYAHRRTVDWAVGAVLLFSRRSYESLGGWDESFFLHSEETDFCLRAAAEGWATVYEPEARAMHIGQASGYSGRVHTMQVVNRVRFYRRRHGLFASWAYFALTALVELSWLVRGKSQSRTALPALLLPSRRPSELRAHRLLPN